jgi:GNAT superfamily N-acetyltransferase
VGIEVCHVDGKRKLRQFIRFPFELYRDSPYWVPPLLRNEWAALDSGRNPASEFCRTRLFLAKKNGRVVGRVAGIINDRANEKWKQQRCRFGWIDGIDDPEVWAALMGAVENWAAEEGLVQLHGPLGFTNFDKEGMLVEGFEELATMAAGYNFPYYGRHMEALGYAKDIDWVEFLIQAPDEIPEKLLRVQDLVLKRYNLRLVESKRKSLVRYKREVFKLLNTAYADLYGVVELTADQIDAYVKEYFRFIDPGLTKIVIDENDEIVAFGLAMPSLSRALQKAKGRILPFGFVHLWYALRIPRRIDFLLVAVRPDFQGKGLPAIVMTEVTRNSKERGILDGETNPELESNTQVQAMWKHYPARQHKRRRCYLKAIAATE